MPIIRSRGAGASIQGGLGGTDKARRRILPEVHNGYFTTVADAAWKGQLLAA
jgi:hypothetical protein